MFRLEKNFLSRATPPAPPSKGKNFWHQIWLDTCSDWKKNFCGGTPLPSKGKNFWHQIWLETCSDQKKNFCQGPPRPPGIARNCYGYAAGGMPRVHAGGLSCYIRVSCLIGVWILLVIIDLSPELLFSRSVNSVVRGGLRDLTSKHVVSSCHVNPYILHLFLKSSGQIFIRKFPPVMSEVQMSTFVQYTLFKCSIEFSRNTQSWQCCHFCTTSNVNKLETVKDLVHFKVNLQLSWCYKF